MASRNVYFPLSFVCDKYAVPPALTRSMIAALIRANSTSSAPTGAYRKHTSDNGTGAVSSHPPW